MKRFPLLLLAALLPFGVQSQTPAPKAADPRVELAAKIPGAKPEDIRPTPVAGIFELVHGADVSYLSADGKYLFSGDLYRVAEAGNFSNLSEDRRKELRVKLLSAVPETEMIVFAPKATKYTISVFTDVDCPWCKRLHGQMAEYNKLGIKVRYLAWPRTNPKTPSWIKSQSVWCSKDRAESFGKAVGGGAVANVSCADPVQRHHELGRRLGVQGTPGIVLPDGELVPGYLPPDELLEHLQGTTASR